MGAKVQNAAKNEKQNQTGSPALKTRKRIVEKNNFFKKDFCQIFLILCKSRIGFHNSSAIVTGAEFFTVVEVFEVFEEIGFDIVQREVNFM